MPLNVYGNTKLSGEFFVRCTNPRHFIVRTSAIYGVNPCRAKGGLNFIELMLRLSQERKELRVVDDEFVTPTPATQIARQLVASAARQITVSTTQQRKAVVHGLNLPRRS